MTISWQNRGVPAYRPAGYANFISAKKPLIKFSLFYPTVSLSPDISPEIQRRIYGIPRQASRNYLIKDFNVPMLIKIIDNYSSEPEDLITSENKKNASQLILYFGDQRSFTDELSYFYSYLSDQEISRSKRFKKNVDERTYVIMHALVNRKISELLKMDFDKIKINYFDNKKPYVDGSTIEFNNSHSSNNFAFALSTKDNFYIGVDIEVVKENFDIELIVKNYFHINEKEYVLGNNLSNLIQQKRFYEVWTRKEAFLKMLGLGITEELAEIDLSLGSKEITIKDKNNIYNGNSPETFISSIHLSTNLVLSLSTNSPVVISLEHCKIF